MGSPHLQLIRSPKLAHLNVESGGCISYILKKDSGVCDTSAGTVQVCLEEGEGVSVHLARVKLQPEDNPPACRMAVFVITHHLKLQR